MTNQNTPARASAGDLKRWFLGIFCFVCSVFGFFMASHAHSEPTYTTGLLIGFAGIAAIFYLIKSGFDSADHEG